MEKLDFGNKIRHRSHWSKQLCSFNPDHDISILFLFYNQ